MARSSLAVRSSADRPAICTRPVVGRSKPASICSSVDLPVPLRPRITTIWSGPTTRLTSRSTSVVLPRETKRLATCEQDRTASGMTGILRSIVTDGKGVDGSPKGPERGRPGAHPQRTEELPGGRWTATVCRIRGCS